VASHPVFNIRGWDPTFSARDVLLLLKQFLQTHARIDFESPRNAAPLAYLPVEVRLMFRAAKVVADVTPTGPLHAVQLYCSVTTGAHPPPHLFSAPPLPHASPPPQSLAVPRPSQVLLAKLEALTGAAAAAQSMQQFQEMYRSAHCLALVLIGAPQDPPLHRPTSYSNVAANGLPVASCCHP
jgi:hypothetical protein